MPITREAATEAAEVRILECIPHLDKAIQRQIEHSYRDGEDIVIDHVYDCFRTMHGGNMARKAEMDEAIKRVRIEYAERGWETYLTYPVTKFRKRPKLHQPILILR
jgi:hypothetical protein